MLILLSPAKDLSEEPFPKKRTTTQPELLVHSAPLIKKLQGFSAKQIGKLMDISPKLAELNHARYASWNTPFTAENARPAVYTFNGEAYRGLDANTLTADDMRFAQRHLRILSGLYGVLRPLDLMQPYRLEMGTSITVSRKKGLYAYWGDRITELLRSDLKKMSGEVVVDLASAEYSKAVRKEGLGCRVVTPVFKDRAAGGYRVVMVYAKQQRGAMARYIIEHRMLDAEKLKQYNEAGYRFSKAESTADQWVYLRG